MSKILMLLKVTCGGPLIYMHKNRGKKRKMGLIGLIYKNIRKYLIMALILY
jgi:hypothetical protein